MFLTLLNKSYNLKITNQVNNLLHLPGIIFFMLRAFRLQKQFIIKHLEPHLKSIDSQKSGEISHLELKKIRQYYGFAVPAILGEAFYLLREGSMKKNERLALTYLGAATGLYDDFFDDLKTSEAHIRELTINPAESSAQNLRESLFIRFYKLAINHAQNPDLIKQRALDVFEAQLRSKKQQEASISEQEIRSITYLKGSLSLLFYRSALDEAVPESEENMLCALGQLLQLENDIFDVYKDHQNNIKTLVTDTHQIKNIRETYHNLIKEIISLLKLCPFKSKNKRLFMRFMGLTIIRGLVCLDCLEKNEQLTNNTFIVKDYERNQLVCDMEMLKNFYQMIRYYSQFDMSLLSKPIQKHTQKSHS